MNKRYLTLPWAWHWWQGTAGFLCCTHDSDFASRQLCFTEPTAWYQEQWSLQHLPHWWFVTVAMFMISFIRTAGYRGFFLIEPTWGSLEFWAFPSKKQFEILMLSLASRSLILKLSTGFCKIRSGSPKACSSKWAAFICPFVFRSAFR